MRTVLMVAEKPSLAQTIAEILSNGSLKSRKAFNRACSVHEYVGPWPYTGEQVFYKMTSTCGHVMGIDFPGKYNNWDSTDPAELFDCPIQQKEATASLSIPRLLNIEAKGADFLVLWLDCDKEGENICFEVVDAVVGALRPAPRDENIYRAKFSALTSKDIKNAMATLIRPNKNEALSVDARMELDLRIGCAFTRFQTKYFNGKFGDLNSATISFGPCQTPTLAFCVRRHDEIQHFKPEPYWVPTPTLVTPSGEKLMPAWTKHAVFNRQVGELILKNLKDSKTALVTSISTAEHTKARPGALNTVALLRVASSGLGLAPHHTMQLAERLYTSGYISYPRTETSSYPDNFDLKAVAQEIGKTNMYAGIVQGILQKGIQKPKKGTDAGDHPPITPTKAATEAVLGESWRLYDYVCRHFLATIMNDCKYMETTAAISLGKEEFKITATKVIDPGFTKVLEHQAVSTSDMMEIKEKMILKVEEVRLIEKKTTPPDYLTESELIKLMEENSVGTDASIPVHINNICQRNYVTVSPTGRKLIPTTLGIMLVHGYEKIDPDLVLATMRGAVEKQLNLIAIGQADFGAVRDHTLKIFKAKFRYFVEKVALMEGLFEGSFTALNDSGKPFSRCGKCQRFMKLISTRPPRLYCGFCNEALNLPSQGTIGLHQELKCPLDTYDLVFWTTATRGTPLCPYCYNNPPFPDMPKLAPCNKCTHPSCSHSMLQNAVRTCYGCDSGILVLETSSGHKRRLTCNQCSLKILLGDLKRVRVRVDTLCGKCDARTIVMENKEGVEKSGCIFCDAVMAEKCRVDYQGPNERSGGRGRRQTRAPRGERGGRVSADVVERQRVRRWVGISVVELLVVLMDRRKDLVAAVAEEIVEASVEIVVEGSVDRHEAVLEASVVVDAVVDAVDAMTFDGFRELPLRFLLFANAEDQTCLPTSFTPKLLKLFPVLGRFSRLH
ncbi:DNA topoisomerase 3-beta-1 [Hypsibius exemplaris]|uniref:DNA topoisomerase n=1 Tax=Hypsibius exemplaris TaxID=2072580 RepID=A0A1W0WMC7_HYPEX|nr:DNA topoisomerase 3-beta-1 [Hypsibius exemplaris]